MTIAVLSFVVFTGNIYVNETWTKPVFDYGKVFNLQVLAENVVDTTGSRLTATVDVTLFISGVRNHSSILYKDLNILSLMKESRNHCFRATIHTFVTAGIYMHIATD